MWALSGKTSRQLAHWAAARHSRSAGARRRRRRHCRRRPQRPSRRAPHRHDCTAGGAARVARHLSPLQRRRVVVPGNAFRGQEESWRGSGWKRPAGDRRVGSGIGRAFARHLARHRALVIVARRGPSSRSWRPSSRDKHRTVVDIIARSVVAQRARGDLPAPRAPASRSTCSSTTPASGTHQYFVAEGRGAPWHKHPAQHR